MSLRKVAEDDLELMLSWRNHPSIRASMFSQEVIKLEDHREWFGRESNKEDSLWLLFYNENDEPSGIIYLRGMDRLASHAFWGFYAAPSAPAGTGSTMCKEALEYSFDVLGLHKINAEVLRSNQRSQALHKKLGFQIEDVTHAHYSTLSKYEEIIRFGLTAESYGHRDGCSNTNSSL